jgi:hypothetical protein
MAEIWLTKLPLTRANLAKDYLGADKIYYEPTDQGVEKWRAEFAKLKK